MSDGVKQMYRQIVKLDKDCDEEGNFKCVKCGTTISPDDTSEETYHVLNSYNNGGLNVEIICKCGELIRLVCGKDK